MYLTFARFQRDREEGRERKDGEREKVRVYIHDRERKCVCVYISSQSVYVCIHICMRNGEIDLRARPGDMFLVVGF